MPATWIWQHAPTDNAHRADGYGGQTATHTFTSLHSRQSIRPFIHPHTHPAKHNTQHNTRRGRWRGNYTRRGGRCPSTRRIVCRRRGYGSTPQQISTHCAGGWGLNSEHIQQNTAQHNTQRLQSGTHDGGGGCTHKYASMPPTPASAPASTHPPEHTTTQLCHHPRHARRLTVQPIYLWRPLLPRHAAARRARARRGWHRQHVQ